MNSEINVFHMHKIRKLNCIETHLRTHAHIVPVILIFNNSYVTFSVSVGILQTRRNALPCKLPCAENFLLGSAIKLVMFKEDKERRVKTRIKGKL